MIYTRHLHTHTQFRKFSIDIFVIGKEEGTRKKKKLTNKAACVEQNKRGKFSFPRILCLPIRRHKVIQLQKLDVYKRQDVGCAPVQVLSATDWNPLILLRVADYLYLYPTEIP